MLSIAGTYQTDPCTYKISSIFVQRLKKPEHEVAPELARLSFGGKGVGAVLKVVGGVPVGGDERLGCSSLYLFRESIADNFVQV